MATILLQNVGASTLTFTQKLQLAASGGTGAGPAGTVYDCTSYTNQSITSAIAFTVPNNTFLFGAGTFTFSPTSGSMFVVTAPGITIQGTSRSSRDTPESGTTTFRMGNGLGQGYHVDYLVSGQLPTVARGDSFTLKNLNFKGIQSVYTSNSGAPVYTTNGGGGILITEANLNASGSNVNNIIIDNVLVDGAKQHGIMIYGAVASKIMNTRVRSAAGHGFYIDGGSTSVSFDTCYASGNYLAGFCLKDAAYSSLNNCASDSNGLGYWLRNTTSTTLVSCGAEANLTRSSIPNNLGIILKLYPSGSFTVNDIGADNVNHIKGTSFFVSGGGNLTFTSPLSKDPGGNLGAGVFANKRTAHFGFYGGVDRVNITAPRISGTTTLKYKYRLEALDSSAPGNIMIDDYIITYDPTNPTESADPNPAVAVADVLDQGSGNVFGNMHDSKSFDGRRAIISNPEENYRIDNLMAMGKFTLPTYTAHPANPEVGTIYFNTDTNKLYIYNNAWYDTCCLTTVVPDCVFPSGLSSYTDITGASALVIGDYLYGIEYSLNTPGVIRKTEISNLSNTVTFPITPSFLGIAIWNMAYHAGENSLYFTATPGAIQDPSVIYICKFSLNTNQIVAYEVTNLPPESYQVCGTVYIVGDYVYVTRGTTTVFNGIGIIERRFVQDLSLQETLISEDIDFKGGWQNFTAVVNNKIILCPFNSTYGQSADRFIVYNTVSDSFSTVPIPGGTSSEKQLSFYKTNDRFYVASLVDCLINEYDLDLNHIQTYSNQYILNPANICVTQSNGQNIATFISAPTYPNQSGLWSLVSYNLTQDTYIGTSEPYQADGTGTLFPASFMIELDSSTIAFGRSYLKTICAPYAP